MKHRCLFFRNVCLITCSACLPTKQGDVFVSTPPTEEQPIKTIPEPPGETLEAEAGYDPAITRCDHEESNHVLNGSFEHEPLSICGWYTFDATSWGVIGTRYCSAPDHEDCVAYLAAGIAGNRWQAQFLQHLSLTPGNRYTLSFEARAAGGPRSLMVSVLEIEPNNGLYDGVEVNLANEWRDYAFGFTAGEWADEEALLVFAFGAADTGLYLDNVSIVEAPPDKSE